jgi:integrase
MEYDRERTSDGGAASREGENLMRNATAPKLLFDNLDAHKEYGSILRKNGSKKLYVLCHYQGRRIEKSTGLDDTPANRRKVRDWLDRQGRKIEEGTFVFAEAFSGATDEEKEWFAQREGWDYSPEPRNILIGDYIESWYRQVWLHFDSLTKQQDFRCSIDTWILPLLGEKTFYQLSGVELGQFIQKLRWRNGKRKGEQLSQKRIKNIVSPLRAIWNDACDEYRWNLPDPFRNMRRHLPRAERTTTREVFRFRDWIRIVENLDPWYVPIAEFMLMTGMIGSEIAGLRREDVAGDYVLVRNSVSRNVEKATLKTKYRQRKIPITTAMRNRLDIALSRTHGEYVFTKPSGGIFNTDYFCKRPWKRALKKAGLPFRVPYCMRHTFAAWSLTIGTDLLRLVNLLGHRDKTMVFSVYGNYVEGLEEDAPDILGYFGQDFLKQLPKTTKTPALTTNFA